MIHNKLKPGIHEFVNTFSKETGVFMMATGDTEGACKKIAKIIDPESTVLHYQDPIPSNDQRYSIIFKGFVPEEHGAALLNLLNTKLNKRPIFYFCSMSMEEKGDLAAFLSQHDFFVVANGDAVNDTHLVANSDFSFVHGPGDSDKTAIKGDMTAFDVMQLIKKHSPELTGDALTIYQNHFLSKNSPLMRIAAQVFFGAEQALPSMTVFKGMKCGSSIFLKGPGQLLPGPEQSNTALVNLIYDIICYAKILATGMTRRSPTFMEPLSDRGKILQASQIFAISASSLIAIGTWAMDFKETTYAASMAFSVAISLTVISVMLGRFGEAPDCDDEVEEVNLKSPNKKLQKIKSL